MFVPTVAPSVSPYSDLSASALTRQKATSEAGHQADFAQIREKGLTAWAHEQKIETLKEKLRAQILAGMKLTEEGVAGLSPEAGASVESEIAKLLEEKLKEAIEQQVEAAARTGKTEAVFLDIMA